MKEENVIFWFRRDLRLEDNAGLYHALTSGCKVIPVFIYDTGILNKLDPNDTRISFLDQSLRKLQQRLSEAGSSLVTLTGTPVDAFKSLIENFNIRALYFNNDYEPDAIERDNAVSYLLGANGIPCFIYRDQVIFEKDEVVKSDGKPYTVFTPYSRKWLSQFKDTLIQPYRSEAALGNLAALSSDSFYGFNRLGFKCPPVNVKPPVLGSAHIDGYAKNRDFPSSDAGSYLGPHLRFGTLSIREVLRKTGNISAVFRNELIWREFFMQVLFHFPHVTNFSFRPQYDRILWANNEELFQKWMDGKTGFPIVDAGMRELKETGYMHNRVRMIAANFLTRHLLTDWRWGETWFAANLLDFELSSNNGNWQWAAGSGCDAAPYFRIFNPDTQLKKFDPKMEYVKKWIPEAGTSDYPARCIDLSKVREKALDAYRNALNS
jgi:deoxyribodipyrimidine photo-lyase